VHLCGDQADGMVERQRDLAAGLEDVVRAERAKHHNDSSPHHEEKATGS
jgi:hypothetical protein